MEHDLEIGQIVQCTVEKIIGTTVFVKIDNNGEGTITTSEISPGRIRNLRNFVVPGKKIICKILSIKDSKIHLSLRRVKQQEKKELLDKIKKEKNYKAVLKTILGKEQAEKTINKITQDYPLIDFFEKIKEDSQLSEKYLSKENSEKLIKILDSKKEKTKQLKETFKLSNKSQEGITTIKEILKSSCKGTNCKITYLAAGKYLLSQKGEDLKKIQNEINQVLKYIEKNAKKSKSEFSFEKSN